MMGQENEMAALWAGITSSARGVDRRTRCRVGGLWSMAADQTQH